MLASELHPVEPPEGGGAPGACEHGGRAFEAIGAGLGDLSRRHTVVAADVLDAWFPPAPQAVAALREHLEWALAASPPASCEGLIRAIAAARGVPEECLAVGAGSSALMYLALPRWLGRPARALVLEPSYGEYAHLLEHVVGCRVHRLRLREVEGFAVPLAELRRCIAGGQYDLVVLVNPNNPTGTVIPRAALEPILGAAHPRTTVWVDEAYAEYAEAALATPRLTQPPHSSHPTHPSPAHRAVSVERFASASENVVVCKSLSKAYALSGARAAYVCGPEAMISELRRLTPPWAVSLPAQIAAVRALGAPDYYRARYLQTHALRGALAARLRELAPWRVVEGSLNAVLCLATLEMPRAHEIAESCRRRGLYIRDCSNLGQEFAGRAVRVSVRSAEENERIVAALAGALGGSEG